ncbi:MAG: hypothetical protein IJV73_02540, partial [Clostridia bacterium]|nr:hypothetical protein [Clostridia bacterium]
KEKGQEREIGINSTVNRKQSIRMAYRNIFGDCTSKSAGDLREGGKPRRECKQSLRPYQVSYNSALCTFLHSCSIENQSSVFSFLY